MEDFSERKEDQLQLVIDTIPVMAWIVLPDGKLDFLNKRWLEYSGLTMDEALQQPTSTIHPEDCPSVAKKWDESRCAGEPYEEEMRLRRADGEYRWFLVRTVPLRDNQGNIVRWYGTSTDIEDRKRAEIALRKSERVLCEAEELGHTGSWEYDLMTGEMFGSEEQRRLFFGPESSRKGSRFEDYIEALHPDDRASTKARHLQLIAEGGISEMEFRVVWADGSVHNLVGRATALRDNAGRAIRCYGTNVEITERRRAEQVAQERQGLLELVLSTLPVGVAVTDGAGDIVLTNEASKRIWGAHIVSGRERWLQSKAYRHDSGQRIGPTEWPSVQALSEGKTTLNELLDIDTYDGRQKTLQSSAAPIRNAQGVIVGTIVVNEDVTERVRAEKALRESAEHLQHLSRRLLTVQEEERRHLSRELHDEFGQLLATITVQIHAAKRVAGEAAQAILEDSTTLLQHAGRELRSLALELRPAMLDTAGLDATLRWLAAQHQQRTGIVTEVIGHANEVSGDMAVACIRIVQEALTNVVRHAQARHIWVELSQSETHLELAVRDDGMGFNVVRTLEQAASHGHLGVLGMTERAQLLGGTLEVVSEPERGTRVRILLPITEIT